MKFLRFMESSRTRNSILDWLIAATLAFAAISGTAGVDFELGNLSLRSHHAVRVLVVAVILIAVRWRIGIASVPLWLTRVVLLTTIGGADSYGYVSASELIARGSLTADAPIAGWLSAANRMAIAAPLGWAPSPDGSGIVPTYPLGLPMLMALFSAIGGPQAVFFV